MAPQLSLDRALGSHLRGREFESHRGHKASADKHEKLTALAHRLVSRDAVDTILLAGTDLTLLFNESNANFPHIDCAALHIREILKELTGA